MSVIMRHVWPLAIGLSLLFHGSAIGLLAATYHPAKMVVPPKPMEISIAGEVSSATNADTASTVPEAMTNTDTATASSESVTQTPANAPEPVAKEAEATPMAKPVASKPAGAPKAKPAPPRPAESKGDLVAIKTVDPIYPSTLVHKGLGDVTVKCRLIVDKTGHVRTVMVEQSSGYPAVDEAAKVALKQWEFQPAMLGKQAITVSAVRTMLFHMD